MMQLIVINSIHYTLSNNSDSSSYYLEDWWSYTHQFPQYCFITHWGATGRIRDRYSNLLLLLFPATRWKRFFRGLRPFARRFRHLTCRSCSYDNAPSPATPPKANLHLSFCNNGDIHAVSRQTLFKLIMSASLFFCRVITVWVASGHAARNEFTFSEWCLLHSKSYSSEAEAKLRQHVYNQNSELVKSLNIEYRKR